MENGITIGLPFQYVVLVISALVSAIIGLVTAIVFIYKKSEKKNDSIVHLTKSFVETTKDHTRAIENNTAVIEKLPEQFVLHLKANRKNG